MHHVDRPRTINTQNSQEVVDWLTEHTPSSSTASGSGRNPHDAPSFSCSEWATPHPQQQHHPQVTTWPAADTSTINTTSATAIPLHMSEELFTHPSDDDFSDGQILLAEDEGDTVVATLQVSQSGGSPHLDVRCSGGVGASVGVSDTSEMLEDDDDNVCTDVTWLPCRRNEEEQEDSSDGGKEKGGGGGDLL